MKHRRRGLTRREFMRIGRLIGASGMRLALDLLAAGCAREKIVAQVVAHVKAAHAG
jgi:hypothetical protein